MKNLCIILLLFIRFTAFSQLPSGPEIIYQKCYSSSGVDYFIEVINLEDGGVLASQVFGLPDGDAEGLYDLSVPAILTKFSFDMEIVWQRYFGGSTCGSGIANIIPLPDGTIMTAGGTCSNDGDFPDFHGGTGDIFLLKTDSEGNKLWSRCYGGSLLDRITGCIATLDGGFLITGYTGSSDGDIPFHYGVPAFNDALIFKTDSAGNIEWLKIYGGTGDDGAANPFEIGSGKYFVNIAGLSTDFDFEGIGTDDFAKMLFCELNESGEIVYQSYYTPDKELKTYLGKSILHNGKIMLVNAIAEGSEYIDSYGLEDGAIAVLDDSLRFSTIKNFGGSKNDALLRVVADESGNYYFLGYSYSPDGDLPGNYNDGAKNDYWLMATDHDFNLIWSRNFGGRHNNYVSDVGTLQGNLVVKDNYITCFISCVIPDTLPDFDIACGIENISLLYTDAWIVRFDLNTVNIIETNKNTELFTVYPNPAQNHILLIALNELSDCRELNLQIIDINGNKILQKEFSESVLIDTSFLTPGIYSLIVFCEQRWQIQKIIIQH